MEMITERWRGCALTAPCAEGHREATTKAVARVKHFPETRVVCNQPKR